MNKRGRLGKQRQRFTQREIARADRGAPNRTIIVRLDGTLELLPTSVGDDGQQNEWDGVK